MASGSHDTHNTSSDAPERIEEVFAMEYKRLRPRSLIHCLKDVSTLQFCLKQPRPFSQLMQMQRDMEKRIIASIRQKVLGLEESLYQKIRARARGDTVDVDSDFKLIFQKISDQADEYINREFAGESLDLQRIVRDKRCAHRRGWVYDHALEAAKDNATIKLLVEKVQTDDCWRRGGGHCAMVDCSAVRWNMVNIVLALIKSPTKDGSFLKKEEVLAIAVEYGHVQLVQQLIEMQDIDVNIGSDDPSSVSLWWEDWNSNNERLTDRKIRSSTTHISFLEPIGAAARIGNVEMVMSLLACDRIDVNKGKPLHWAAAMEHPDVVKQLLKSKKEVDVNGVKFIPLKDEPRTRRYGRDFSPLHLASLLGHASVVKALCEDTEGRLNANAENERGITAFQIATEEADDETVKILLERPEVAKRVDRLYKDRKVHVDAANAVLVGAALIASVTFAGWLTPPLGYSTFFGSASIEVGAPSPSGIYPSFVSVAGHPIMQIFWFFNSMSFFFAIATLMVGASAARPPKRGIFIGEVVRSLRASLSLAYILLTISVGCVMGAFASAGFLVLPPIPKYKVNMGVTVGIGVTVVFCPSKVVYVLKVMKMIVKETIFQILNSKIMRKILSDKIRMKVLNFRKDD